MRPLFGILVVLSASATAAQADTSLQHLHREVLGCGKSYCDIQLTFATAFPDGVRPSVTCSAGPAANKEWGPLTCMIESVTATSVTLKLDSANGNETIQGVKTIDLIAAGTN